MSKQPESIKPESEIMPSKDFETCTPEQIRRAALVLVAREALVGRQPYANGGALTGAVRGKAPRVDMFELIEVTAYLESGTSEQLKVVPPVDTLPSGLTLSEDGELLNWRGQNYIRQPEADPELLARSDTDAVADAEEPESEPLPRMAVDAVWCATVDAAWRGLAPEDPCPGDPSHLVRAHFPGGAWYGTALDHKKVKS